MSPDKFRWHLPDSGWVRSSTCKPLSCRERTNTMAKAESHDLQQKIDELNARVHRASLRGAWQRQSAPRDDFQPWVWRWKDILPNILAAGDLIPIDDTMKMRTIHLVNPYFPVGTTRTFAAMLQHLNAGEVTQSHRHTASSVYFMIQGSGLYTTADGEQQFMEPGDLLTQPNWTWHGSRMAGASRQYGSPRWIALLLCI